MELKRVSIYMALFLFAVISQCSDAHLVDKRQVDSDYDDPALADEASDDAQNDADGGDEEEQTVDANITSLPSHYNITVGKTVRLDCRVEPAYAGVVVQWSRNGAMYFMGTQKTYNQDLRPYIQDQRFAIAPNSSDLIIADVRPADSGTYKCEILQWNHPMVEHNVIVTESPRIVKLTASDNGRVTEGSDLLLTCEVAGSPAPHIIWSKYSDEGNKRLGEKDGNYTLNSLFIRNVTKQTAGKYYCYAMNSVGSYQKEITITVIGKPHVHVHRTIVNSDINVTAVLQCSARDEPAPHIRWYKDGSLIEDAESHYTIRTSGSHSELSVTPTSDSDFGTFTCEAENSLGKHNRSIELVQRPVVEGLDAEGPKLTWTVHSHQPLKRLELQLRGVDGDGEWQQIDIPLPKTKSHEYEIIYVLDDKQISPGKYEATVKAENDHSWSSHSAPAAVEVEAQPQYIQHASVLGGGATFNRPETALLSTVLMYLLVRLF